MCLIIATSIPRALIIAPSRLKKALKPIPVLNKVEPVAHVPVRKYEECCSIILELGANKPLLENFDDKLKPIYTKVNIDELVHKLATK